VGLGLISVGFLRGLFGVRVENVGVFFDLVGLVLEMELSEGLTVEGFYWLLARLLVSMNAMDNVGVHVFFHFVRCVIA
jgi:hypothetical protein